MCYFISGFMVRFLAIILPVLSFPVLFLWDSPMVKWLLGEVITSWRTAGSPSVALYRMSSTHCDIWLGSRNEISFCQMLKATKVAKFFMFPPLCSLILEPDLDKGKKEKVQKLTEYEGGTSHSQLLSLSSEHQKTLTSSSAEGQT